MFDYQPPDTEAEIIYCDDDLLLVNKPANLLSVPGRRPEHQDCLLARSQCLYPDVLLVHRLDMSTSGLLILARNTETQRRLSRQFEQRLVKKSYLAVVTGHVRQSEGQIDLPLRCDWPHRPRQIVDQQSGKTAQTDFRVLRYDPENDSTRLELYPVTGRTHQLRVHMQALGHPILGDDLYADELTLNKADRLLLHAWTLGFNHPTTDKPLFFSCTPPF